MPDTPSRPTGRLTPTSHNGILMHVPGQNISDGSSTLPKPSEAEKHKPERKVEIDSPELGLRVRITYRLNTYRHYKSSYWSWSAVWADVVESPGDQNSPAG